GLEHKNSSVLLTGRDSLPAPHLPDDEAAPEAYADFLGLASHEYFHRWNVRRIRPLALAKNEWQRENYTRLLWFFEGATSYYDDLCLVRAGLMTEGDYLSRLGKTISRVWQTPGRLRQSLAEASFDAWIKYYRPDENTPNAQISYYNKGALLALWLDLELRLKSLGKTSLDDLMRDLWRNDGASDSPIAEEEIFRRVARLGGMDTARALEAFVEGTGDLPLEQSLARAGVRLEWRPEDKTPWLGVRCQSEQGRTRITHVLADSPAERAGLIAGDTLLALAGREIGASLPAALARLHAGQTVSCHYFRRGLLAETKLSAMSPPAETASLTPISGIRARKRRTAWLAAPV
ncbi:MAG: PDZ domain-containing protein, partial [Zoogloeaceae bacterium]|nr:PDZ domain-containing protein [Zoogloeaceae bacterium]